MGKASRRDRKFAIEHNCTMAVSKETLAQEMGVSIAEVEEFIAVAVKYGRLEVLPDDHYRLTYLEQ